VPNAVVCASWTARRSARARCKSSTLGGLHDRTSRGGSGRKGPR
jgi:hypothetical protein